MFACLKIGYKSILNVDNGDRLVVPNHLRKQLLKYKFNEINKSACSNSHANRVFMPVEEFVKAKDNIVTGDGGSGDNGDEKNFYGNKTVEDVLFEMFQDESGKLSVSKFLTSLGEFLISVLF